MATEFNVTLAETQFLASGNANLFLHNVHAGDHLCNRVFNLYASVHLDEVELAVFVQELECARTAIPNFAASFSTAFTNALNQAAWNVRRRCFLNYLLVAALHGAIAFTKPHGIFVFVGQNLDFNVARIFKEFFHVNRGVVESRACLGFGHGDCIQQCSFGVHHAHAAPTAAARSFDNDRVAHLACNFHDFTWIVGQFTL